MSEAQLKCEAALNRLAVSMAIAPPGSAELRERIADAVLAFEGLGTDEGRAVADAARAVLRSPALEGLAEWLAHSAAEPARAPVVAPGVEPVPAASVAVEDDLAGLQTDPELAAMFIAEALDHLATIENTLLQLEITPGDDKLLNDVFRPFHTIKGNSGALGLGRVQQLAHTVESLLDLARSGRYPMGAGEFDAVLQSVDVLSALIRDTQARLGGGAGQDLEPRRLQMVAMFEGLVKRGPVSATNSPATGEPMIPVAPVASGAQAPPESASPAPVLEPVRTAVVPGAAHLAQATPALPGLLATPPPETVPATEAAKGFAAESVQASVKVDTRKLDSLVDMVGELVIVQSIIQSHPGMGAVADEALGRQMAQLRRISSDLQRNAMAMRMVPIRQTFQKMARLVRDLTRKSGKKVELVLVGEDTELDRRVVEDITDPLMHMVRNSVDHGLESPDGRLTQGKSETGKLTLCAYHQGGNIVIGILDDGRGLDVERIRAKAIANGLLSDSDQPTDAELHQMIFRPGLSTAEKVTEVSGRGVGMDVVRRNIEALRGWIEIHTEPGKGTSFYIKLPLTLAIVDGLVLGIGRERYVLPTFAILESLRPTREQVHTIQGQAMVVQVRDRLVPILPLGEHFGLDDYRSEPWEAAVVIVEDDGRQVGLLVDELLGKQEVVIKSLGPTFAGVMGVSGGAILGDGRVGLILDVHAIVGQTPAELARMV